MFTNNFLANIKINEVKKILMPYEGQPFQKEIINEVKKKNKKIKIFGYDHTAPQPLPLNLNYSLHSPDILLTNSTSQSNFYSKYLNWPSKKIKVVPSLRFKNISKNNFVNKILLPYKLNNIKIILNKFTSLIESGEIVNIKNFKIKNHPLRLNSNIHKKLILQIQELIKKNLKKKNIQKSKKSVIIIGQTTAVTLSIETGVTSYHICLDPVFDSYTKDLWNNIKIKQLSRYTFKYELNKKNTLVMIKKEKNLFKKYYDKKV